MTLSKTKIKVLREHTIYRSFIPVIEDNQIVKVGFTNLISGVHPTDCHLRPLSDEKYVKMMKINIKFWLNTRGNISYNVFGENWHTFCRKSSKSPRLVYSPAGGEGYEWFDYKNTLPTPGSLHAEPVRI